MEKDRGERRCRTEKVVRLEVLDKKRRDVKGGERGTLGELGSAHLFGRLLCENDVRVPSITRPRSPANRRALRNPFS